MRRRGTDSTVEPADLDPTTAAVAYRARIYLFWSIWLCAPHVADDLTQETTLRALRAAASQSLPPQQQRIELGARPEQHRGAFVLVLVIGEDLIGGLLQLVGEQVVLVMGEVKLAA